MILLQLCSVDSKHLEFLIEEIMNWKLENSIIAGTPSKGVGSLVRRVSPHGWPFHFFLVNLLLCYCLRYPRYCRRLQFHNLIAVPVYTFRTLVCLILDISLIEIHLMLGWTITMGDGVTRIRSTKRLKLDTNQSPISISFTGSLFASSTSLIFVSWLYYSIIDRKIHIWHWQSIDIVFTSVILN